MEIIRRPDPGFSASRCKDCRSDIQKSGTQVYSYSSKIVVAYMEGKGNTLKTYKEKDGKAYLHPENPEYDDIPIEDCKILGIVIKVIKDL